MKVFLWDVRLRIQLIHLFSEVRRDREKLDLRDSVQLSCPKQLRVRRVLLFEIFITAAMFKTWKYFIVF